MELDARMTQKIPI